jgi:hypothetical protein
MLQNKGSEFILQILNLTQLRWEYTMSEENSQPQAQNQQTTLQPTQAQTMVENIVKASAVGTATGYLWRGCSRSRFRNNWCGDN